MMLTLTSTSDTDIEYKAQRNFFFLISLSSSIFFGNEKKFLKKLATDHEHPHTHTHIHTCTRTRRLPQVILFISNSSTSIIVKQLPTFDALK